MTFCDEVKIAFIGGKGGNGCISFRREKYIPRGGPDGGNGGDGGSIYLETDENINTLSEFNIYKTFRAKDGKHGKGKKMTGEKGEDLILKVPVGTLIYDENKKTLLADLTKNKERFLVDRGGKGGFGNAHFISPIRQAPKFAELGEPGEKKNLILELKLVADVGIIGLPSVGKSSLISRISNARPKIAPYPFTTLVPNLGVVNLKDFGGDVHESFAVCDLPGLIEGAHTGKGLGIQFLKHVARNRVFVHMLDGYESNLAENYQIIREELKKYDKKLLKLPEIIVINKIDLLNKEEFAVKKQALHKIKILSKKKIFAISCVTGANLKELVFEMWKILAKTKKQKPPIEKIETSYKVFRPHLEKQDKFFEVSLIKRQKPREFKISGKRIEQIVVMTDFSNLQAVNRVYDVLKKMGIQKELMRRGAKEGSKIHIGDKIVIFHELW